MNEAIELTRLTHELLTNYTKETLHAAVDAFRAAVRENKTVYLLCSAEAAAEMARTGGLDRVVLMRSHYRANPSLPTTIQ